MAWRSSVAAAGAVALVRWGAREGSEQEFAFKGSWPVWGEQAVGSAWVLPCWKLCGPCSNPGHGCEGGSDLAPGGGSAGDVVRSVPMPSPFRR